MRGAGLSPDTSKLKIWGHGNLRQRGGAVAWLVTGSNLRNQKPFLEVALKTPNSTMTAYQTHIRRLLMSTATGAILIASAQPAFAQDAAAEPTAAEAPAAQEIVVTGSRISRRDFQA